MKQNAELATLLQDKYTNVMCIKSLERECLFLHTKSSVYLFSPIEPGKVMDGGKINK